MGGIKLLFYVWKQEGWHNMYIELKEEYRNIDVKEWGFSNRTYNILRRYHITNVYELAEIFNDGITVLRGVGVFVEEEVRSFLKEKQKVI